MKINFSSNIPVYAAIVYSASFVLLACIGGFLHFSAVPYWDMWANFNFYNALSDGNYFAWWEQHNEHRIVFERLLFLMDFVLFNGSNIFLIAVNYILTLFNLILFLLIIKEAFPNKEDKFIKLFLSFFICILMFSWIQKENLTWAFQSQFFLAQLLPLTALYFLYLSAVNNNNTMFLLACLFGIASLGTMANGVLALPLMLFISILLGLNWRRLLILCLLSMISLYLYFANFHTPGHHSSVMNALFTQPFDLVIYALTYLGGPFYYIAKKSFLALSAGIFLTISFCFFSYQALKSPKENAIQVILLGFIAYIGLTACATAGGRVNFGLQSALSSRYMTPDLMAWSALLILYALYFYKNMFCLKIGAFILVLISFRLFDLQLDVFKTDNHYFERDIAALALELDIQDHKQLKTIYPDIESLLISSRYSKENDFSIFGHPKFKNSKEILNLPYQTLPSSPCLGYVDNITSIPEDPNFLKINGWLYEKNKNIVPEKILILDDNNKIIGFALSGQKRKDILNVGNNSLYSGFKGYLQSSHERQAVSLIGNNPDCHLVVSNLAKD